MGIWQTSVSNALGPGVYGVNVKPPLTLVAQGEDVTCIVEQFPWGPSLEVYEPTDPADQILTFYPPGMNRNLAGPLALSGKGWPDPRICRVTAAAGTAKASAVFSSAAPVALFSVQLLYVGTAGNSCVGTTSAPQDGVSGHCNVSVSVTGLTGTTTDTFLNVDTSSAPNMAASIAGQLPTARLVGGFTWEAAGTVVYGSTAFSGGLDGTVAATDYVGTLGLGDKGLALTESHDEINHIFFGNPGSTLLPACNAGMQAHVNSLGSRTGFVAGVLGQSSAAAITDVATYRADNLMYVDAWMQQISDQDSTIQTIPTAPLAASVAAQLSVSTHISWRDPEVAALMDSVAGLEQNRGQQALTESNAGICVLIKKRSGGYAFYTDVTSNSPVNAQQPRLTDQRVGQYIIVSAENGFQTNVEGPNVPTTQLPMRAGLQAFMAEMVYNASHDPAHNPYVKSFSLGDDQAANPTDSLDAGDYVIPVNAKTDKGMVRIFIPLQFGPTVSP